MECKYPDRVGGKIPKDSNVDEDDEFETFFTERSLEEQEYLLVGEDIAFSEAKSLDESSGTTNVERYLPLLDKEKSLDNLRIFFEVLTRIVIYVGFASFFFGCQTPFTHLMHNFQKIWVHIYVAALTINSTLKTSLMGFRECQDQNIAINPKQWESGIPDPLFYDAPAQYTQYYQDITFFRNIYNVGFAFAILLVFFVVAHFYFRKQKLIRDGSSDQRFLSIFKRHMKVTFYYRPAFYINSIFYYQYFTVVLACCLQFIDLNPVNN